LYPKGYISRKARKDSIYCYLSYRCGSQVKSDYIGKADSPEEKELLIKIQKRKDLELKLKQTKKNLKEAVKQIHG
jgi:hypothetical protein